MSGGVLTRMHRVLRRPGSHPRATTPPAWLVEVVRPAGGDAPGSQALAAAVSGAVDLLTGKQQPDGRIGPRRAGRRERLRDVLDETVSGHLTRIFTVRLMVSVGVAAVASQVLPLQRSYWVVLTVAIVLRPDFGSVFARALQRGSAP